MVWRPEVALPLKDDFRGRSTPSQAPAYRGRWQEQGGRLPPPAARHLWFASLRIGGELEMAFSGRSVRSA